MQLLLHRGTTSHVEAMSEAPIRHFPPYAMRDMTAPARTLLLVVDVQVDFAAGIEEAEAAVARIERLVAAARKAGVVVGFARVVTRRETDGPVLRALHERLGLGADEIAICRAGTPGADFHRVRPEPGDLVVTKTRYSCFAGTTLEGGLRTRGIDTIVATGLTTDCCVEATVRDAFDRDFHVFVVADACASDDAAAHMASLRSLGRHCAVVVESTTVLAGWASEFGRG